MKFIKTPLLGCYIINNFSYNDLRGKFVKSFSHKKFAKKIESNSFQEQFYTISKKNVIRGIHFQIPPYHHYKLVSCLIGQILDVIVDLRYDSSTYKKAISVDLHEKYNKSILIPPGCGHGFLSLSKSLVMYNTSTEHSPKYDKGVLWSSIEFDWPVLKPILSKRDKNFPSIDNCKIYF